MVNLRKNSQKMILLILIIIFSINTNFYKNLYKIISHKFDNRITKTYGYCNGESIGYLLSIKKKYQINDNPKILNYIHTPAVNWAIINTKKINQNSNKLIFLNYPGSNSTIKLKKISNNLFELVDAYFLKDKFSRIDNVKMLNSSINSKKLKWTVNVFTVDKLKIKKNIKTLKTNKNSDVKLKINLDMNLDDEQKLYFKVVNEDNINLDDLQLKVVLKNKYILENFQIINKHDNCYYVKKI
tara:strand:- start:369 stop:1091 length:723 start_codon:yes stop_codon:yes gene_type:complete